MTEKGVREHNKCIHWYHPQKSAVAEHNINLGCFVQLQKASILAKKSRCMDHIIREVTEIELHTDNVNKECGFSLSRSWKPLICDQKEEKKALIKITSRSGRP
jgi:hypothetical protein